VPLLRLPLVTIALILADVIVYVLALVHGGSFFDGPSPETALRYGAIPYELTHPGSHCGQFTVMTSFHTHSSILCLGGAEKLFGPIPHRPATWLTVLTSIFLHGSFLSLLANAAALALFGLNVEDALGRVRFLAFYVLGAVAALALTVLFSPSSQAPALGSAGAVAAVLGAYLSLFPRARIIGVALIPFFATIVEAPAALLAGVWLLAQPWVGLADLAGPVHGRWALALAAQCAVALLAALAIRPLVGAERRAAKRLRTPPEPVY
jgi:membrane associated rhomboid family serine protease